MFVPDMPSLSIHLPQTVLIAKTNSAQSGAKGTDHIIGECELVDNQPERDKDGAPIKHGTGLYVSASAIEYLRMNGYKDILGDDNYHTANITIIRQPQHGHVEAVDSDGMYSYTSEPEYFGMDYADALVEVKGMKVEVRYFIHVLKYLVGPNPYDMNCTDAPTNPWKIPPGTPPSSSMADFATLLTSARRFLTDFTDLPAGSVGQTTDQQITLDDNATNHGWYLDYTPYLNEAFLPTSNPNEWIARPGSEAEGRMDPLSVLLHEYGHVLGLDHSTNAHDFMAATLAPVKDAPTAGDQSLTTAEDTSLAGNLLAPL